MGALYADLYSFDVEVSSAVNNNIRSAYIRTSKTYRDHCDVPVLEFFYAFANAIDEVSIKVNVNPEN